MLPDSPLHEAFAAIATGDEMRALESRAFLSGSTEDQLMQEAGAAVAAVVKHWLPQPGVAVLFAGKGHNAGDAFVVAGHLHDAGWKVELRLAWPVEALRPLAAQQFATLSGRVPVVPLETETVPAGRPLLLIDGLLGIGSGGALRGEALAAVRFLNNLRQKEHALTLAIDLPSGLGGDPEPVTADLTVTLGYPKNLLFTDEAAACTGRLKVAPLTGLSLPENPDTCDVLTIAAGLRRHLLPRPAFSRHKGDSGRIAILAGSTGLTGAARLASTAASMMGGGLVTLFCPASVYEILAAACPPEVMVQAVDSSQEVRDFPWDALGVGPGLGATPPPMLADLLLNDPRPIIVDADALNALAGGTWWKKAAFRFIGPRLLTPHPGELARLIRTVNPALSGKPRREQVQALVDASGAVVLAKSALSFVLAPGRPAIWNGTGHPLMARGGMGDVLTGFLTTFAAQGLALETAAALGSWVLGRGAECYHDATGWEEPGLAGEVMRHAAGAAMAELRAGQY